MHHPVLFFLGLFLLLRFVRRARMRRFGFGGHGEHFGRHHRGCRHHNGPIDLGAPDADDDWRGSRFARRAARWAQRWERAPRSSEPTQSAPLVKRDVAGALELNPRQKTLFADIVAKAKGSLPVGVLAEALVAVGQEPFSRDKVEELVGPGDLADDLLQLHHSLTDEQRARLREVTSAN